MGNLKPLFENEVKWKSMVPIIESWKNTPYRHMAMVKGRGADCTLFLAAIYKEAGYLKKLDKPEYYPRDWAIHTDKEFVKDSLAHHLKNNMSDGLHGVVLDDEENFVRGDLLGFQMPMTQSTCHTTMWMGDENWMVQCVQRRGVCYAEFNWTWRKRLTSIFRIMEEEQ